MFVSPQPTKQTADILTFSTLKEETPVLGTDSGWVVIAHDCKVDTQLKFLHGSEPEL